MLQSPCPVDGVVRAIPADLRSGSILTAGLYSAKSAIHLQQEQGVGVAVWLFVNHADRGSCPARLADYRRFLDHLLHSANELVWSQFGEVS